MLKILLIILLGIILAFIAWLFMLGYMSKSGTAAGLTSGLLTKCADKPNCVNSEFPDDTSHYIPPIGYPVNISDRAMTIMSQVIIEAGGTISISEDNYTAATFTSAVFGFVDDLECRNDPRERKIHIRSASRVGKGDLDANKKRVELISHLFSSRIK